MPQAQAQLIYLLHQSPLDDGLRCSRWRLQDLQEVVTWLANVSLATVSRLLKRFHLSRKCVLSFVRSPDPQYQAKLEAVEQAKQQAVAHPAQVELLFGDELTYYRSPTAAPVYHQQGRTQPRIDRHPGPNTQTRVLGAMNAVTGQVLYLQRSRVGAKALCDFASQLRQAYPQAQTLYLVLDNWPTHKLPAVLEAFAQARITLLFLPTYASWLNPIEKLWRYLRQQVLHAHRFAAQLPRLRELVLDFLNQFARGSQHLLRYVGLLLD